jgi:phosphate transport system protein
MDHNDNKTVIHMEYEESRLKRVVLEMMLLVSAQLRNACDALFNMNQELAEDVLHNEEKVNAYELSIERDCHNILALQNPVATDLRFVLAMFKINAQLERIGDHAKSIAKFVLELGSSFKKDEIEQSRLKEMSGLTVEMMDHIVDSFENENTGLARKVFKKDKALNKINKNAAETISSIMQKSPKRIYHALIIFSTIKKLERTGDLCKNMAEEIIYHLEAKIIKHKKKKWKL